MRWKAMPVKAFYSNANSNIKEKENTPLNVLKLTGRPTKTPIGRGLGKAGAKRLGRLLKRAVLKESNATGKVSLPNTPVRLFKHQIQTEAQNAFKTNTAKQASSHVSQLILSMVSQCKHQGCISMAELKKTLASAGYNATKNNNKQVDMVSKKVVINETLVRTTRNSTFTLSNKKQTDTQLMTSSVKSKKPEADHLKQSKTTSKSTKEVQRSQRQARKASKLQGKSHKPKSKTCKTAAKSYKLRRKTLKARRKTPKPVGKKRSSHRVMRNQRKQKKHLVKSPRKRQPRKKLLKRRSRYETRQRRITRRRVYYY